MAARTWPELTIDRRDLPCNIYVRPHDGKMHEWEVTLIEQEGKLKVRIRSIDFGGKVVVSSEWLES